MTKTTLDKLLYLTIQSDTGQHPQFLQCFAIYQQMLLANLLRLAKYCQYQIVVEAHNAVKGGPITDVSDYSYIVFARAGFISHFSRLNCSFSSSSVSSYIHRII